MSDWPVFGIDVSKWQGVMDWDVAKSRGISFAIIRNSYRYAGVNYQDPQYVRNCDECDRLGITYGVYHYIIPQGDASQQAIFFADRYRGQLPPWMDVEDNGGLSAESLATWLQTFADTLQKRLDTTPGIYTRATFWNAYVAERPDWGLYPLWIARYDETITNPYPPYTPRDWPGEHDWSIWQYSAGGNGLGGYYGADSSDIDLNRYDGDIDAFQAEFGLEVEEPPTEDMIYIPAGHWVVEFQSDVIIRKPRD